MKPVAVFRLAAVYHEAAQHDPSRKDNCLKGTGTRVKREATGNGACAIGNGQVYRVRD